MTNFMGTGTTMQAEQITGVKGINFLGASLGHHHPHKSTLATYSRESGRILARSRETVGSRAGKELLSSIFSHDANVYPVNR